MEIQVRKLRDALDLIVPVIPRKTQLKPVSYVRLGEGRAVATDLQILAAFQLPEANEDLLLPGKEAMDFLKYALGAAMAQITADDGKVTINVGGMETSFTGMPSVWDFPSLPKVEGENQGVINGDVLVKTLVELVPYAATETNRPVLNGVFLAPGEEIEAAAADGYRLAWRSIPGRLSGPSMIIPLEGLNILERSWKRAAAPDLSNAHSLADVARAPRLIRLNWGGKHLKLSFDSVTLIIQLIQGTFPNYHQLIPQTTQPPVTVDAEDMERLLAQVAPVAKQGKRTVRLQWEGEVLQLSAIGDEQEVTVSLPAQSIEPGFTALNVNYLREYFKGRSGPVSLQTETYGKSPVLFTHRGRSDTLVMPMFVEKKAEAKAEAKEPIDEAAAAAEAEIEAEVRSDEEVSAEASAEELDAEIDAEADAAEAEAEVEDPVKKKRKAKAK